MPPVWKKRRHSCSPLESHTRESTEHLIACPCTVHVPVSLVPLRPFGYTLLPSQENVQHGMRRHVVRCPHIFLMAGEPSSDAIGAKLMTALRHEYGSPLRFTGVGGQRMAAAGLEESLFPMSDLSVMGFAELVPALPRLAMRLWQTIHAARTTSPDIVIGIDSKAFCLRVLANLAAHRKRAVHDGNCSSEFVQAASSSDARKVATPTLVQYVAPSAWAFADAPSRAAKLAGILDELLVLLPFEAELYGSAGVPCTFVGHPALDDEDANYLSESLTMRRSTNVKDVDVNASSSSRAAVDFSNADAICLLPGSRHQEIRCNLPHMLAAADLISSHARNNSIKKLLLPAPESVRSLVQSYVSSNRTGVEGSSASHLPVQVCSDSERFAAFQRSRLAIACSGTINVELAKAKVPQVAVYRTTRATSLLIRHILRPTIEHATLPNIINTRGEHKPRAGHADLIPELLFESCTPAAIADAALRLLTDPSAAARQVATSSHALDALIAERDAQGSHVPSTTLAARALLKYL